MTQKNILASLVKEKGYTQGIEIGVLDADTTKYLLENIKELHMVSVDPSPTQVAYAVASTHSDRFRIVRAKSDNAFPALPAQVDFVWIDGDHAYEQVKRDIVNYWPLVRIGGMMGGHDWGGGMSGVKEAAGAIFKNAIVLGGDFTWWVNKSYAEI